MGCPNQYYKPEETYYPRLYCKLKDSWCMYTKRCQKVEKFIALDNDEWKGCYIYMEDKINSIPNGSNFVQSYRPNKSNGNLYLYVLVDNNTVKIPTELKEFNQDYIYIKKNNDKYEVSLTPFVEEKKNEDVVVVKEIKEKSARTYNKTRKKNYKD